MPVDDDMTVAKGFKQGSIIRETCAVYSNTLMFAQILINAAFNYQTPDVPIGTNEHK